jgi:predicted PurR-regulated permease PerM
MRPLIYVKAVIGAAGATAFPPIFNWLTTYIPVPQDVRTALSILLVALVTGGVVYATPNQPKLNTGAAPDASHA